MSVSAAIEQSEKKRAELNNELTLLEQKMQATIEEMRTIEEELTAKLEEKVKEKRAASEKLESQKRNMEKQLEDLQNSQEPTSEPSSVPVLCKYCGSENIPKAKFCEKCGKSIE
jgi:septal ring factor EnvC (AmiA/AmiB activator)